MQPSKSTTNNGKATGMVPDYFVGSIQEIDFKTLQKRNVKFLVVDVDHTLVLYQALELDKATKDFLNSQRQLGYIKGIYLASNSSRDLSGIANGIDAKVIRPSLLNRKPRKVFYKQLLATIGCNPSEAVMVGDKLINDVWGGNQAGMFTILVNPIGPDMLIDRLILRRFWGKRYLRKYRNT